MITTTEEMGELFDMISDHLNKVLPVYMIGGGALIAKDIKDHTKDVDLVVTDDDTYNTLTRAILETGFEAQIPGTKYGRLNLSNIFIKGGYRIDLFSGKVCGKLMLSESMVRRAELHGRFGKIDLYICSLEDILLFKCITDRQGDYDDCVKICISGIRWDDFLEETVSQSSGEKEVWITYVSERLTDVASEGYRIPILDSLQKMAEEYLDRWSESLLQKQASRVSKKKARVIRSSCKGCHECVELCPSEAISFEDGGAVIDQEKCTGCGSCMTVCRFDVIMF